MPINETYPTPQADRLDKVAAVVDAVVAGANTIAAIAEALCVVDRQGAYYANAAAYLGLIEVQSTIPASYELTADGSMFCDANAHARAVALLELVGAIPAVQEFLDGDLSDTIAYYQSLGLDTQTATRRAATAGLWCKHVTSGALDTVALDREAHAARANAPAIAAALHRARQGEHPSPSCPSCHTELPRTGVCDTCS